MIQYKKEKSVDGQFLTKVTIHSFTESIPGLYESITFKDTDGNYLQLSGCSIEIKTGKEQ